MVKLLNTTGHKTLKFLLFGMAVLVVGQLAFASKVFADTCGNGVVEAMESCDDGNLANGDFCSDTCGWEICPAANPSASCGIASCANFNNYWEFENRCYVNWKLGPFDKVGASSSAFMKNDATGNFGADYDWSTWVLGKRGNALSFNGQDQYISIVDRVNSDGSTSAALDLALGNFSISGWFKTSTKAPQTLVNKVKLCIPGGGGYPYDTGFHLSIVESPAGSGKWVPRGSYVFDNIASSYNVIGDGAGKDYADGNWHHFVWTVTNMGQTMYADGVQVGQSNSTALNVNNSAYLFIGRAHTETCSGTGAAYDRYKPANNPRQFFNGAMDELTFWKRALSATEAHELFCSVDGCAAPEPSTPARRITEVGATLTEFQFEPIVAAPAPRCNQICIQGSCNTICICDTGWSVLKSGGVTTCVNVNECTATPTICSSIANSTCSDSPGAYSCLCNSGYSQVDTAGVQTCVDTDGCAASPCFAGVVCEDILAPGTGRNCGACPTGYVGNGITCTDRNDCTTTSCYGGLSACHDNAAPTTGFTCDACPTGYTGTGIGAGGCTDRNDCTETSCFGGLSACHDNAAPATGFTCDACPEGYTGNGVSCTNKNECEMESCQILTDSEDNEYESCTTVSSNICGNNSQCTDLTPLYRCSCNSGYSSATGDGKGCADINECLTANGGCGNSTFYSCTNNVGATPTCADINECLTDNGGCGSATLYSCTNNAGAAPTCTLIQVCGNGAKEGTETCDDIVGTPVSGDGCSATCATEPGWACPTAGTACTCTNLTKTFSTEDAINYLDLITSGLTLTSVELVYFDTNCDKVLDSSDGINIYDSQT